MCQSSPGAEEAPVERPSAIGVVVAYLIVPPIAVLGVIYGASHLAWVSFGQVIFWLTLLVVAAWLVTMGSYQTGAASSGGKGRRMSAIDITSTQRGTTGTDMDGAGEPSASDTSGMVSNYLVATDVSTSYLVLILTVVVIAG